jgi:outer membrane receptor protein involved in Fe transport
VLAKNGFANQELRKCRWNLIGDYRFSAGTLKGVSVGGGVRWQDKVAIGYAVQSNGAGGFRYDLAHPYFGPSETNYDFHLAYERPLTARINWKVQFNAHNLFDKNHLIPIQAQPDGTFAQYRIAPEATYTLTNTFSF